MARRNQIRGRQKIRRLKKKQPGRLGARFARLGRGLLSLSMLASLFLLGYMSYQYYQRVPLLQVGEIRIMGCLNARETELLGLAQVDFKDSLMNLDLKEVGSRLARHPWVETARVQRDWSRKALVIEVRERVPQALILFEDLYLVDQNGDAFKKAGPKERLDFPVLTGLNHAEVTRRDAQAMGLIRKALDLLEHLQGRKAFTSRQISEIHLHKQNGLTVFTIEGAIPIRLGAEAFPEKLTRLEKILPDLMPRAKEIEYVDLNYPTKAVVKTKVADKAPSRKS